MAELNKDYGTNNPKAYEKGECLFQQKHAWKHAEELGRCYNLYICERCGAKHKVDSSD